MSPAAATGGHSRPHAARAGVHGGKRSDSVPALLANSRSASIDQSTCRTDPRLWSENQLAQWLAGRGLPEEISRAFEVNLVNGLLGEDLNDADLARMGIGEPLHQRRVALELRRLFDSPSAEKATLVPTPPPSCPEAVRCGGAAPRRPRPLSARMQQAQASCKPSPYMNAVPSSKRSRPRSANAALRLDATPSAAAAATATREADHTVTTLSPQLVPTQPPGPSATDRPLLPTLPPTTTPSQQVRATPQLGPLQPRKTHSGGAVVRQRAGSPSFEREMRLRFLASHAARERSSDTCGAVTAVSSAERAHSSSVPDSQIPPSRPSSEPVDGGSVQVLSEQLATLRQRFEVLQRRGGVGEGPFDCSISGVSDRQVPLVGGGAAYDEGSLAHSAAAEAHAQALRPVLQELAAERRRADEFERRWRCAEVELAAAHVEIRRLEDSMTATVARAAGESGGAVGDTAQTDGLCAGAGPVALPASLLPLRKMERDEFVALLAEYCQARGFTPPSTALLPGAEKVANSIVVSSVPIDTRERTQTIRESLAGAGIAPARSTSQRLINPDIRAPQVEAAMSVPPAMEHELQPLRLLSVRGCSSVAPEQLDGLCREFRLQVCEMIAKSDSQPVPPFSIVQGAAAESVAVGEAGNDTAAATEVELPFSTVLSEADGDEANDVAHVETSAWPTMDSGEVRICGPPYTPEACDASGEEAVVGEAVAVKAAMASITAAVCAVRDAKEEAGG